MVGETLCGAMKRVLANTPESSVPIIAGNATPTAYTPTQEMVHAQKIMRHANLTSLGLTPYP